MALFEFKKRKKIKFGGYHLTLDGGFILVIG